MLVLHNCKNCYIVGFVTSAKDGMFHCFLVC